MYFSLQLNLSGPDFACSFGEKSFSKAARKSPERNAVCWVVFLQCFVSEFFPHVWCYQLLFVGSVRRPAGCRCVRSLDTPDDESVWTARGLQTYVGTTGT